MSSFVSQTHVSDVEENECSQLPKELRHCNSRRRLREALNGTVPPHGNLKCVQARNAARAGEWQIGLGLLVQFLHSGEAQAMVHGCRSCFNLEPHTSFGPGCACALSGASHEHLLLGFLLAGCHIPSASLRHAGMIQRLKAAEALGGQESLRSVEGMSVRMVRRTSRIGTSS